MTRVIHIAGTSGSGKSLITLNLAIALQQRGRDVLVLDSNIYQPDLFNYANGTSDVYLNDYLRGERRIEDAIVHHPSGIKIIPSLMEEEYDPHHSVKINQALLSLMGKAEIILVDSFSHNPAFSSIFDHSDEIIFVMNDDAHNVVKSKELIRKVEERGMGVIGTILNKKRKQTNSRHVQTILDKPVLAEIPHDDQVIESINMRVPAFIHYPKSALSRAMKGLAETLDHGKTTR
ncbi:AAA family ATPase [Candidatus Woesearchaeota archaeon]|nr:AAA family ATPase [Candidatus Woesearchaeota archaeon]